jgi:DNA polymerase V
MFALFDASNFYASVEQSFRPSLQGRPLVVLSNNDGCAIARSQEAKALGIKMGAPWFKISHLSESHGLLGLSANFTLYGVYVLAPDEPHSGFWLSDGGLFNR